MKTDDLIRVLAADSEHRATPFSATMTIALICGSVASMIVFALWMGPRPDFVSALASPRFPFKVFVVAVLALAAIGLVSRAGRPGARLFPWALVAISSVALLLASAVAELLVLPSNAWLSSLNGTNRLLCLALIPGLAALPLFAAIMGLRYGAPRRPAVAGGIAGLAAGAIGATLYALYCNNDSPLFVATWYSVAIALVVIVGTIAGSRSLHW